MSKDKNPEDMTQKELLLELRTDVKELIKTVSRNDESLKMNWKLTWAGFIGFFSGLSGLLVKIVFFK